MRTLTLKPDDLRVESFAIEAAARNLDTAPEFLRTTTRDPKDCPETLPQFCTNTKLC